MAKREVKLTFPETLITEPVIYNLGHTFEVVTSIKRANVTKDTGWVDLELEGETEEIERAISDLRSKGIDVRTINSSEYVDL
ncbi:NIL domain-containing protein [bacterium]|nr:NIL domain-containing protein [bacterium]